ncbi:dihydrofolate reductase family protein [Sphaerisporangium perillae]|uniref:dihydrofolate reductase family protein n=1 Tax=Sphaerisporangium perillae TaxID=2935860 RepID=UPI00200D298C|nr:dihydrofolate reductase family protein [Sphaerisporangium perillae]
MREVILSMFVSVDGYIENSTGQQDWNIDAFDDEMERHVGEQLGEVDALLLGRRTYELFAQAWPTETGEVADKMNGIDKVVFSRTLKSAAWHNTRIAAGDVAEEIAELRRLPGKDMLIYGSAEFARDLMRLGLIDEYRLWVHPVVLGDGKQLFENFKDRIDLKLVDTRVFDTGVCILRYRPA